MIKDVNPIIKKFIPLVNVLAKTFGENCEVVLHDFSNISNSIVAIENGHITGRTIDSAMTDITYKKVVDGNIDEDIINYTGKSKDGSVLKSSTTFIRDDDGKVIGCFCINFDLTELVSAKRVLDDIMKIDSDLVLRKTGDDKNDNVSEILSNLVNSAIDKYGKPIIYMTKEDKVEIVKKLEEQGTFRIKGAIDYLADVLCVSRYTIYNYLDEIR